MVATTIRVSSLLLLALACSSGNALPPPPAQYVDLATFDGAEATTYKWRDLNDPVMGGRSHSTWVIDTTTSKTATWNGTVEIVPSLRAPGFCNAETSVGAKFADASSYSHLMLLVRSTTEYSGWKFSFAADTLNPQFNSFKSNFNVTADNTWQWVAIAFDTFSNDWSPYTGNCDTKDPTGKQHHCCSPEHRNVCPTSKNLRDISQLGIWGEGVQGDIHLEVARIGAGVVAAVDAYPPAPAQYVDLATFDGAARTTYTWLVQNDPVMGGRSHSTFTIDTTSKTAVWNGTVEIVPSLKAPGFVNVQTQRGLATKFADASQYSHFMLLVRSSTAAYLGWKATFTADTLSQFKSFKTNFNTTEQNTWQWIALPFDNFSNDWSPYTGNCDTKDPTGDQHHCCSPEHRDVCPTSKNLRDIAQVGIWAEGVQGDIHIEVARIGAGIV